MVINTNKGYKEIWIMIDIYIMNLIWIQLKCIKHSNINLCFVRCIIFKYLFCILFINFRTCKSDSGIRAFTQATNNRPPRGADKIRAASGPSILPRPEDILINDPEVSEICKSKCVRN